MVVQHRWSKYITVVGEYVKNIAVIEVFYVMSHLSSNYSSTRKFDSKSNKGKNNKWLLMSSALKNEGTISLISMYHTLSGKGNDHVYKYTNRSIEVTISFSISI